MRHKCEKCVRLWRDYGTATAMHVRLDNKLRFAALQDDHVLIESLTLETEAAERNRNNIRESIRLHEWTHDNASAT
jgi:hypothetical protein